MSKKMLKRSLALGALMAFVITGSAMAAEVVVINKNQEVTVNNNLNDTFNYQGEAGSKLTINNGIRYNDWSSANVEYGRVSGVEDLIIDSSNKPSSEGQAIYINHGSNFLDAKTLSIAADNINLIGSSGTSVLYIGAGSNKTIDIDFTESMIISGGSHAISNHGANCVIDIDGETGSTFTTNHSGNFIWVNGDGENSETSVVADIINVTTGGTSISNGAAGATVKVEAKNLTLKNSTDGGYVATASGVGSEINIIAAEEATIEGNLRAIATNAKVDFYISGKASKFDGKTIIEGDSAEVSLNFANGATWNLTEASTVSNVTFGADSKLVIDGKTYEYSDAEDATNVYALNAAGTQKSLTVTNGAKLQIEGIEENVTYNIAQGFDNALENGEKWTIDNNLLTGTWTDTDGLQVTTVAKNAEEIAADMGVDSGTASALGSIIEAANSNNVPNTEAAKNVVAFAEEIAKAPAEVAAAAAEAVIKMAEAGGNSATAANIVKNVTGVTNDRLSFNCGHSAPHKGGHGVGLLEEGSGADIWAEYVHGKDKVEDMPSTAGATSYEGQYNGFVMGVDFKKVNKFQSGVAFNYGEGDTNTVGSAVRTRSDYDFWGVGYYGNIHNDDSNVIFDINYAKTDSDVTQKNLTGDLEASPETTTWTAGIKLEKLYQNENVQIVPYTGLRYMSIDSDDYATKCGTYKYSMDRQDIWLLPVGVSIKQEIVNDNGWTVSPRVDLSYIWAFGDTDSNMEFATALNTKTNIGYDVMDDGSFLGLVGIEAHKGQWGYGVAYSYQKGDHSESKKWYVDVNYSF